MKNFYDTLGVAETASEKEIKDAFKSLAKKHHPDRGGDEKKFKEKGHEISYIKMRPSKNE